MRKSNNKQSPKASKVISFLLQIGDWKTLIPDEQRRILITYALNNCVREHQLKILGYLITRSDVYLLFPNHKYKTRMKKFYKLLNKEVSDYLKSDNNLLHQEGEKLVLFKSNDLYNENLKKMITGRKAEIDYYTPQLRRLQNAQKYNPYCSVIDYSGGISPVIVTVVPKEFWRPKSHL